MNRLKLTAVYALLATIAVCSVTLGTRALTGSFGTPPRVIPYKGYLELNGVPVTGQRNVRFRLYESDTSATALWTGATQSVQVSSGHFTAYIGQGATVLNLTHLRRDQLWIGVEVDGVQLAGRQRLLSTAHAITAAQAQDFTVAGNLRVNGTLRVDGDTTNLRYSNEYYLNSSSGFRDLVLGTSTRRVCFLTTVWGYGEDAACNIQAEGSNWVMVSWGNVICRARCIQW